MLCYPSPNGKISLNFLGLEIHACFAQPPPLPQATSAHHKSCYAPTVPSTRSKSLVCLSVDCEHRIWTEWLTHPYALSTQHPVWTAEVLTCKELESRARNSRAGRGLRGHFVSAPAQYRISFEMSLKKNKSLKKYVCTFVHIRHPSTRMKRMVVKTQRTRSTQVFFL